MRNIYSKSYTSAQEECAGEAVLSANTYRQMAADAAVARSLGRIARRVRWDAEEEVADPEMDAVLKRLNDMDMRPTRHAKLASIPLPANDDDAPGSTVAPVRDLVTKAPGRQRRRSGVRQSADARKMRAHRKAAKPEAVEERTSPLSPPSTAPAAPTPSPRTTGKSPRGLASWADAGELPRIIAINRALADLGKPFAFSLNLAPKVIRAANDNVRGFVDFIRRRVALSLKRELGRTVPMWFVVETTSDGRPHLHGGLAMNDNEDPAVIERALAKAGGNWTTAGSRPADVRVQWAPDGWAVYPLKRMGRSRRHLREAAGLDPKARVPLYAVTNDLRAAGEKIHADIRRALAPARSVSPDLSMADQYVTPVLLRSELDRESAIRQSTVTRNYRNIPFGIIRYQKGSRVTITRYIRPDKFGIASAFEIDDGFVDMITAKSKDTGRQVCADMEIRFGEHGNIGGWVVSRPVGTSMWVLACSGEPRPGNVIAFVSPTEIPLNPDGSVPEHLSGQIFEDDNRLA